MVLYFLINYISCCYFIRTLKNTYYLTKIIVVDLKYIEIQYIFDPAKMGVKPLVNLS